MAKQWQSMVNIKTLSFMAVLLCAVFLFGCAHNKPASESSLNPAQISSQSPSETIQTVSAGEENEQELFDEKEDYFEKEEQEDILEIADPLSLWNTGMYHVNDKLYFWFLKPVAQGYAKIVPESGRILVNNFFENITTPIRFVNNLLQLKIKSAGTEIIRFAVNSSVGVAGLYDVAKTQGNIKIQDEDFGQTLGFYGVGHGFYIVWPFLGPSSLRDTVGRVGDRFLNPISYINPTETGIGINAYDKVNNTSLKIGQYEDFKDAAIDPYIAIRDAYIQHRKSKVDDED
jgi:phospholipid-binding lipoprotein MlaA